MKTTVKEPQALQDAILYFGDPDNCLNYIVKHRWPEGVVCPICGRKDATFLKNQRKWQCRSHHAMRQFSAKTGTIFEDSPLGLDKWLTAVWMITTAKNGVSSYEIHRAIGVTQKTAWFMMHRIRKAMQTGSFQIKLSGHVVDETFIGGKARFMHKSKRAKVAKRGASGKTIVFENRNALMCKQWSGSMSNRVCNLRYLDETDFSLQQPRYQKALSL